MAQKILQEFSRVTHFELPLVSSSFKTECHPNAAAIMLECDSYVMDLYGIKGSEARERFVQYKMGLLSCYVIPQGVDDSKMVLACKFMIALFTFDDVVEHCGGDDAKDLASKVVFEGELPEADYLPQFRLMREVVVEFRRQMTLTLFARFKYCLCQYLESAVEEVDKFHQPGCVPDPATYHLLRKESICAYLSSGLVGEFCMGIEVEKEDYECEDYKSFVDTVTDYCIYTNDLFSFRKEFYNKEFFNWVFVFMAQGLTLQEAIHKICQMLNDTDENLVNLQHKLIQRAKEKGSNDLMKFALCFPLVASGHLRWCYSTSRYHGCNNPLLTNGEPFAGTWILHPDSTVVQSS